MDFVDYYKILGLSKTASANDIKKAYRKFAKKYHPDIHPDDKDAKRNFQLVNEANEVLSDPGKREKYDQYGKDWEHAEDYQSARQQQPRSSQARRQRPFAETSQGDFSSFFEAMFGGMGNHGRSNTSKRRGEDYSTEIQLSLAEAYTTHQQTLNVNGNQIRITIPAGIEHGQTIKIAGHGGPGTHGSQNGDLYITFSIGSHPGIQRRGIHLYSTHDLALYTAVLGGEITIVTLDGKVKIKVKPGTQNGSIVKLKGKGFPQYKTEGRFGDLFITYNIIIPTNLSDKERILFEELAKSRA